MRAVAGMFECVRFGFVGVYMFNPRRRRIERADVLANVLLNLSLTVLLNLSVWHRVIA